MKVCFSHQWLMVLLAAALAVGCGKGGGENDDADSLRVSVQIPAGENPELFWFGVEKRELQVNRGGGESETFPWNTGQRVETKLEEGDGLSFRAFDAQGRLLVAGEATVGKAKIVSIPVRRVL